MIVPELSTRTSATVEVVPQLGLDGSMMVAVMIKQLFVIDGHNRVHLLPKSAKIHMGDELYDPDSGEGSIKFPADICLRKPFTDVIVVGSAVARGKQPVKELDVLVRVGPLEKIVRVFGLRVWYRGMAGLALSSPQPFEEVELKWELAYGGTDHADKVGLADPRNPVGRGVARDSKTLVHQPGPQIEDPRHLIRSHTTKPPPAGVGAIGRQWEPRVRYAGTYDEVWQRERMPLPPADFDERFHQCATEELITPTYLRGGEIVDLHNVSDLGPMRFELPRMAYFVGARSAARMTEYRAVLDTVLIQPTHGRTLEMTWRAAVPVPRPSRELLYIQVHDKAVL